MPRPSAVNGATEGTLRPVPIGLYVGITLYLPDRVAERLPDSRPGVRPHLTLAHAQVSPVQVRRLREAWAGRAYLATLSGLAPFRVALAGVGDFRTDTPPTPVVYLKVTEGADQLATLAACLDIEFDLPRRFAFHPHVTLAWRDAELDPAEGDAALDRLAERFADFTDAFTVRELTFTTAHGTILAPRRITWHRSPQTYPLA